MAVYQQKGYTMAKNDSKTRAFNTTAKPKNNTKHRKSKKRIRQQVVISIFSVIALILVVFATLIIGKIIMLKKDGNPTPSTPESVYTVPCYAEDVKKGDLLLINTEYPFDYAKNNLLSTSYSNPPDGLVNLWAFKNNSSNNNETKINNIPTYELANPKFANQICLEENTLHAFNQMLLDYCQTLNLDNYISGSASNINVAWGWSHQNGLVEDIEEYGNSFHNHADGKSITLMYVNSDLTSERVTENVLKNKLSWIYENAHKYGFIIRYPNACKDHTGFDSNARIHLRYVGVAHATYIYENGCCLDKYIETLRTSYSYNNPLEITANGKTYNVYYVAASGTPTNVPVPENKTYYISGDNVNGFILTVVK